jgi:hypothetical protein
VTELRVSCERGPVQRKERCGMRVGVARSCTQAALLREHALGSICYDSSDAS